MTHRSYSFIAVFIAVLFLSLSACKKDKAEPLIINPCGIDFGTTLHYVAIGDGFGSGQYLDQSDAWPSKLVDRLDTLGYEVTDFSFFGGVEMTSAEMLTSLNAAGINCKNVATILVGAEDHFTGRTLEEFRADYRALIARVKTLVSDPDRVTCVSLPDYSSTPGRPPGLGTEAEVEAHIMAMNEIILDEAVMAGVNFANIFPISQSAYEGLNAYVPQDQLHATAFHNELWAEIIVAVLEANL
jgi:hypothetical protein